MDELNHFAVIAFTGGREGVVPVFVPLEVGLDCFAIATSAINFIVEEKLHQLEVTRSCCREEGVGQMNFSLLEEDLDQVALRSFIGSREEELRHHWVELRLKE